MDRSAHRGPHIDSWNPASLLCGQPGAEILLDATIPAAGRGVGIHDVDLYPGRRIGERCDGGAEMVVGWMAGSGAARIGRRASVPTGSRMAEIEQSPDRSGPKPYCAVTIISGQRRLDLALPTAVCCSDLLPGLLRLMLTEGASAGTHPWALAPIGRDPLTGSETLAGAGVLEGDLLVLEQRAILRPAESVEVMTRDRIEDVVNGEGRFWGPPASRRFAYLVALLCGAVLLLPAANLPAGPVTAAMSATVAVILAMVAVLADRRSENVCAAGGLALACGWAALAGATAFHHVVTDVQPAGPAAGPITLMIATGSALLLAGCAAACFSTALVHTIAFLVLAIASAGLVLTVATGAPVVHAACGAALVAALLLGGLPRLALATAGLTGSDPGRKSTDIDSRIHRADRVLIGGLIGVSTVTAGTAIPAALSGASGSRALAVGFGLLLLLRSRAYSQTRHVLAPRVGGAVVLGVVWLGLYLDDTARRSVLILGAAVATAALVVVVDALSRARSPVGLARRGRLLELAEQVLVIALTVLTAWVVVLAEWVMSVIG